MSSLETLEKVGTIFLIDKLLDEPDSSFDCLGEISLRSKSEKEQEWE